jgi:adenylate cyclase
MAVEIERKFLLVDDGWRAGADPTQATRIRQGYLVRERERSVRVRLEQPLAGGAARGTLTIKGAPNGAARLEVELPLERADAEALLAICPPLVIDKERWRVPAGDGRCFEVDVFDGPHAGLVLAELELENEHEAIPRPSWLGREVTDDARYQNAVLSERPGVPS